MKKLITGFYALLDKLCFVLIAIGFGAIVVILGIQIVLRMISSPTMWAEEICRYLFIWLLFMGGGIAFSKGGHLMVDVLFIRFPKVVKLILNFVYYVIILCFSGYMAYSGYLYSVSQWARPSYTVSWLPLGFVNLGVTVGSVIAMIYILRELFYMATKRLGYLDEKGGALD